MWLGNVPAGASPSDVKAEIASHGYGYPHFVKVLKSKHAGVKLMNCIVTMPSAESATDLLHGYVTWSNGKHAVIRSAFEDKKPTNGESADEAGVRWKRDQLVRQLAQIDSASSSGKGTYGPWHRATGSASSSSQSSVPGADTSVDTRLKAEIDKLKTNMKISAAFEPKSPPKSPHTGFGLWVRSPVSSPPPQTHRTNPYLLSPSPKQTNPPLMKTAPKKLARPAPSTWDDLSPVSPASADSEI